MRKHTQLSLVNCVKESGVFGDQYRPICPGCGKESQNSISMFGKYTHQDNVICRDCGKLFDVRIANYEEPLNNIDEEIPYFENILNEWLKKTVHIGKIVFMD